MKFARLVACVVSGLVFNAVAATPGMPFIEDFTDTNLYDSAGTTANWSVDELKLIQAFHGEQSKFRNLPWTASTIGGADATRVMALGDVTGNGLLDLVVGNYNQVNRLYTNNGTASPFAGVVGVNITADTNATFSVALGDMTGNGFLDLVVGNSDQANRLYTNNGTANPFAGVAGVDISGDTHDTYSVTLGDVTGNGFLDLVVGNFDQVNRLYTNNGTANPFAGVAGVDITADPDFTTSVALGDVTGNGFRDLVAGNIGLNRLYTNNGTATPFAGVVGVDVNADAHQTASVALGDMTGNGLLDLVAGNWNEVNRLYINNGSATPFAGVAGMDITSDAHKTHSITLGDMTGAGRLDIVVGNEDGVNRLYLNNGRSTPFEGVASVNISGDSHDTWSVALGDINGNGLLDIVAGNETGVNRLYLNNGVYDPFNGAVREDIGNLTMFNTYSVALGDVTGNGLLDLVAGNAGKENRLYTNNGTASPFEGVVGMNISGDIHATESVALGDVNGNGHLDLVVGNYNQATRLYTNNGTATPFSAGVAGVNIDSAQFTHSVALGDVTGNGLLDLVVGNRDQVNRLYTNNGTANPFVGVAGVDISGDTHFTHSVALGDVTGNGFLDLVAGNYDQATRLYTNNGTASPFVGVVGVDIDAAQRTRSVALGDVTGNGLLDLVVGNQLEANRLYTNNGTATPFEGVAAVNISGDSHDTWSVALGDVNGNGHLDLVACNLSQASRLYLNNGTANPFAGVAGVDIDAAFSTRSVALGDVTGNGHLDLVEAGSSLGRVNRLYLNNGRERRADYGFLASDITDFPHFTYAMAIGDINRNGFLDLVVGDSFFANRLYLNDGQGSFMAGQEIVPPGDNTDTISVALGDITGNGLLDLVVGNIGMPNLLYTNNGTASPFDGVAGVDITADINTTTAVALGDMTGNGLLDLVTGNDDERNRLYTNNGTANPFAGVTGIDISTDEDYTTAITLGDVTGNGFLDLIVGIDSQPNRLYTNNGTANPFDGVVGVDITTDDCLTYSVKLGDMNGNGLLDLVTGNDGVNRLYTNNGTGNPFDGVVGVDITDDEYITTSVALGDMSGNGRLDVVTMNWGLPGRVYLNNGDGTFAEGVWLTMKYDDMYASQSVVLGDIDRDGNLDVIAGNMFQPNRMYLFGRPFDFNRNVGGSLKVNDSYAPVAGVDVALTKNTPPNTSLDFYLSNNGGTNWVQAYDGKRAVFKTVGNDVRWKAVLKTRSSLHSTQLDELTLIAVSPEMLVLGTNGSAIASGAAASIPAGSDFGSVLPTGALTNTFAITNSSDVILAVSGWSTNGADAAAFRVDSMPASVAPGGIAYFNVKFAPAGEVARAAALHIINHSGTSPYIINLAGKGAKHDQTIAFPSISDQNVTSVVTLAATASSGLAVSFTNTPSSPVLWSDSTTITFTSTGTVGIIASQSGNAEWNSAPDMTNVFNVIPGSPEPVELAAPGDYTGDGKSDLVVYDTLTGNWFIRGAGESVYQMLDLKFEIEPTAQWGGPGYLPVPGDYNGNGVNDFAVYGVENGLWYIKALNGSVIVSGKQWGGPGFIPVAGDYDGNGIYDMAVYDLFTGNWYIRGVEEVEEARSSKVKGERDVAFSFSAQWGGPTMLPVSGDYDGSGMYDLAVYEQGSGNWFIRGVNEALSSKVKAQRSKGSAFPPEADQPSAGSFSTQWGGPGFAQVSGDYDGDGKHDLAVYHQALGLWYVIGFDGRIIAWAEQWGGPGFTPLSGDYTGDGKSDLAVYDIATGQWYVRTLSSEVVMWNEQWGGAGFLPVMAADAAVKPTGLVPVRRLYSFGYKSETFEHFFTANAVEAAYLASTPYWIDEGTAWYALVSHSADAFPLYRVYSETTKVHYWTIDVSMYNTLVSQGWTGEGVSMYVWLTASAGRTPVYQFYNTAIDKYLFTTDEHEKNTLIADPAYGYSYHGIAFYVYLRN